MQRATVVPLDGRTVEGLSVVLATNHLAPYVLLRRLAQRVGPRRRSRFVMVGADPVGLAGSPVDLDDLPVRAPEAWASPADLWPFRAYGRTKDMTVMTMVELSRRLAGTTVAAAHPGIIAGPV